MAKTHLTISGLKEAKQQLEELNKEFEKAKNDPIKSKKLAKEFNDLSKEVDEATKSLVEMNEAGQLLGVRFDDLQETLYGVTQEVLPLSAQIGEMEDRMYQLAAAGQAGNAEFVALQTEAARLRKVIIDTDKSVDLLAENQGLSVFGTGLSQVGESILRLDFATAAKDAKALNNAVGNLGQMGTQALTGMAQTVGQLGKAFLKMGAALFANPIFLIAAVIAAVIAVIVKLMDELGFLQPILDWIGLTTFAAEDAAKKQIAANQKVIDSADEKTATIVKGYDQEIRLAQIAGEDTVQAEIKKQEAIIQTQQVKYQALLDQIEQNKISKSLSAEEVKQIQATAKATRETIEAARFEIKAIRAQETADNKKELEEQAKTEAENYKKRLEEKKAFEEARLAVARQIKDLELESLKDGLRKDLELNREKYKRLIEDTQKNEKLLSEQKQRLIELYTAQENTKAIEIATKYEDERFKAEQDAIKKQNEELEKLRLENEERVIAAEQERIKKQKEIDDLALAQQQAYNEARLNLGDSLVQGLQGLESLLTSMGVKTAGLQKTIALIQIATDTAKAISAVVAGATAAAAAGGPAAPFLIAGYIASGIGTVLSAIASAKNALQSAPSLGGTGGGSVGSIGGSAASVTQATPSFSLFGQNNNANNLSEPQDVEKPTVVKVNISEAEITGVQNKVKTITESAAL